jgi:hypothetical protein
MSSIDYEEKSKSGLHEFLVALLHTYILLPLNISLEPYEWDSNPTRDPLPYTAFIRQ